MRYLMVSFRRWPEREGRPPASACWAHTDLLRAILIFAILLRHGALA